MSYQVLARKWRPRAFDTMVGQEHVLKALISALNSERLHHAYLFTGTRGVGKTTIARILAKCLNCEQGVSAEPCGQCSACLDIDQGRFIDLIEVDAASRTKVDDTRELLENVPYAPTQGRFKVYLIDEVHMFSKHSFNALLKTLEEPPEHVKFLLATTDPQKLPITILSRCLQFNLKRLPPNYIQGHLSHVLQAESVGFDEAALALLARSADGSMRDALSLLDQAIAYGEGQVQVGGVEAMLGRVSETRLLDLLDAVAAGRVAQVMAQVAALDEFAPDYESVLQELLGLLHRMAMQQALPEAAFGDVVDGARLQALGQQMSPEDVQLYYQIGLHGRRDFPLAPDARQAMEMLLLRMLAFRPLAPGETVASNVGQAGGTPQPAPAASSAASAASVTPAAAPSIQREASAPIAPPVAAKPEPAQTPTEAAVAEPSVVEVPAVEEAVAHEPEKSTVVEQTPAVSEPTARNVAPPQPEPESPVPAVPPPVAAAPPVVMGEAPPLYDDVPPWLDHEAGAESLPPAYEPQPSVRVAEPQRAESPTVVARVAVEPPSSPEPPPPAPATASPADEPALEASAPSEGLGLEALEAAKWPQVVEALAVSGMAAQLVANSSLAGLNGREVTLHIEAEHSAFNTDLYRERVREALSTYVGQSLRLKVVEGQMQGETLSQQRVRLTQQQLDSARERFAAHPLVQALQTDFGATIERESVQPLG